MAFNVSGQDVRQVQVPTFSSLVTNSQPSDLPEGASPDNADVAYLPGSVVSRPAFQRVFTPSFTGFDITYAKSYVDNKGIIRNLYLDAAGNIWVEDITEQTPSGIIGNTIPNSTAKSITAFGREYIAIPDYVHGVEVPLQYDGEFLDRVTQDGPGTCATVVTEEPVGPS